jgi:hypothetical protein
MVAAWNMCLGYEIEGDGRIADHLRFFKNIHEKCIQKQKSAAVFM